MFRFIVFMVIIMSSITKAAPTISPTDPGIVYLGRVDRSQSAVVAFDWPGIVIKAGISGTTCSAIFEGTNRFDVFIDGILKTTITTKGKKTSYSLADNLTDRPHQLVIAKRTESPGAPTLFYGLQLDDGKMLQPPQPQTSRAIEFIGDSHTAGFANEYLGRECRSGQEDSIIFTATNTNKAFGPLTARAFSAQYQINAVSGKGLVRNYNGIDKGRELPVCYQHTLLSNVAAPPNRTSGTHSEWKPDVVVIGIGINDFQADPPYPDSSVFDKAYHDFINNLRKNNPKVNIICCATKVWPENTLIPRIKAIVAEQKKRSATNIRYFEYSTQNGALYGHPHIHDHKTIARKLIPIVAEITGWRRTDMNRGM